MLWDHVWQWSFATINNHVKSCQIMKGSVPLHFEKNLKKHRLQCKQSNTLCTSRKIKMLWLWSSFFLQTCVCLRNWKKQQYQKAVRLAAIRNRLAFGKKTIITKNTPGKSTSENRYHRKTLHEKQKTVGFLGETSWFYQRISNEKVTDEDSVLHGHDTLRLLRQC